MRLQPPLVRSLLVGGLAGSVLGPATWFAFGLASGLQPWRDVGRHASYAFVWVVVTWPVHILAGVVLGLAIWALSRSGRRRGRVLAEVALAGAVLAVVIAAGSGFAELGEALPTFLLVGSTFGAGVGLGVLWFAGWYLGD